MACRNRSSTRRQRAAFRCWMRPARWSRRCTPRASDTSTRGRTLILIGHAGHPEVEGTMGQVGAPVHLVSTVEDVARLELPDDAPVAYVTQTTLSVDDTARRHRRAEGAVHRPRRPRRRRISAMRRSIASRPCANCAKWPTSCWSWAPQQLELQPAARDRRRGWRAQLSDRRRQRAGSGMAARREGRRPDRRCVGAGGTGRSTSSRRCAGIGDVEVEQMDGVREDIEFRLPAELRTPAARKPSRRRQIRSGIVGIPLASGRPDRRLCAQAAPHWRASAIRWC